MASRIAARYASRRLSNSGKFLSEEEKAAENVYIKKTEKEKLEKLAHKGPKPEEKPVAEASGFVTDTKPSGSISGASAQWSSTTDIVAGSIASITAWAWYIKSMKKLELI